MNLISKQGGMTRFRDVIEFVLFVASVLNIIFTFCLITQNIRQLETTFLIKLKIESLITSTYRFQLVNSADYYLNKQLGQYVTSCLEMRDNLLSKAWYCFLTYFLLLLKCFCNAVTLFYDHVNKARCCCYMSCLHTCTFDLGSTPLNVTCRLDNTCSTCSPGRHFEPL